MEECNFRKASRDFISGHTIRFLNLSGSGSGIVIYRLKGNSSVDTIMGNRYISAAVNLAPLRNIIVKAHSNGVSPTVVRFVTGGRGLSVTNVVGILGGGSNLLKLSNKLSDSFHSLGSTTRDKGRSTTGTVSILYCNVTGFINKCITTVGNMSTVMFATNVNRGTVPMHRGIMDCLKCLKIALSGRTGKIHKRRVIVSAPSSGIGITMVPAGRRLTVYERAMTLIWFSRVVGYLFYIRAERVWLSGDCVCVRKGNTSIEDALLYTHGTCKGCLVVVPPSSGVLHGKVLLSGV